jgi:hypothetical protein
MLHAEVPLFTSGRQNITTDITTICHTDTIQWNPSLRTLQNEDTSLSFFPQEKHRFLQQTPEKETPSLLPSVTLVSGLEGFH